MLSAPRRIASAIIVGALAAGCVWALAYLADGCNRGMNCNFPGQQNLRASQVTARMWLADHPDFEGFDASNATRIEPAVSFTDEATLPAGNVVSIRVVSPNELLMVTAGHDPVCVALRVPVGGKQAPGDVSITYGYADAHTMAECAATMW